MIVRVVIVMVKLVMTIINEDNEDDGDDVTGGRNLRASSTWLGATLGGSGVSGQKPGTG